VSPGGPARRSSSPGLLGELWLYLRRRRSYWIVVPLIVLLVIGAFLALAQGPLAPFIYALF
jgi:hypothetical protein